MVTFFLIRHATNEWVQTGRLAGWTPNVHLNDYGKQQAAALGERLAKVTLTAIYSSPLERTVETANAIAAHHNLTVILEEGIGEVRYGKWQGKKLEKLAQKKRWAIVQNVPSRMQFPEGETMRGAQMRAVDTIERLYLQYNEQKDATIALVSHSDIIRMIIAHYLGMHLDLFQRINISTASLSVLVLGKGRPTVERVNDTCHNPPPPPISEEKTSKDSE
ncbi:MAG: phosphoglycerate mutase [Phototrophicales bacterium]|nr:MAG: phosphoglycerate mutase [Phototrophicales bacterium]